MYFGKTISLRDAQRVLFQTLNQNKSPHRGASSWRSEGWRRRQAYVKRKAPPAQILQGSIPGFVAASLSDLCVAILELHFAAWSGSSRGDPPRRPRPGRMHRAALPYYAGWNAGASKSEMPCTSSKQISPSMTNCGCFSFSGNIPSWHGFDRTKTRRSSFWPRRTPLAPRPLFK